MAGNDIMMGMIIGIAISLTTSFLRVAERISLLSIAIEEELRPRWPSRLGPDTEPAPAKWMAAGVTAQYLARKERAAYDSKRNSATLSPRNPAPPTKSDWSTLVMASVGQKTGTKLAAAAVPTRELIIWIKKTPLNRSCVTRSIRIIPMILIITVILPPSLLKAVDALANADLRISTLTDPTDVDKRAIGTSTKNPARFPVRTPIGREYPNATIRSGEYV